MQFLDAVNRLLRIEGIIRGDTDVLTAFTNTNHNSTSQVAQIAIQSEIAEASSRGLLPYQHTINSTLTMVTNQRSYPLPANFIQLWGSPPFFLDLTRNYQIVEYSGGENHLRNDIINYRTQYGSPNYFYFELGTTQEVSFFQVPNVSINGTVYNYDYSASVNVLNPGDTIPFPTIDQQYSFCDMAARRFKFLFEGKVDMPIDQDPVYREARARLYALIKGKQPSNRYGSVYRSGGEVSW